jgi:transposase
MIKELKLEIAKLRRDKYGVSSERSARLLDQLELKLEELEAAATEDALAAEQAQGDKATVKSFTRRKPFRKPFPEHLPRERVVVEAPTQCTCCGSDRIVKMGEDVTDTLEVIPRQWKVIQTVREKFTCRTCEKISQAPAPFHTIPRGWAGPSLIAMVAFEKFGQHQPLNRQAERFTREGVEISLSTLADLIGHATVALAPIHALIENHVLSARRLHGDDTTVPLLARGGTKRRDYGPMCAMTGPSMAAHHQRHCFTSRATAKVRTRKNTSPDGRVCCNQTSIRATTACICSIAIPAR